LRIFRPSSAAVDVRHHEAHIRLAERGALLYGSQHRAMASRKVSRPRSPNRAKGRPTGSQATVGSDVLIDATRKLLRTRAPREITRKEIAAFAKVDPALIRYYFHDKERLLLAATMQIEREHRAREHAAVEAAKTPAAKLKAKIRVLIEVMAENPHYNQLIQEQIHGGTNEEALQARHEMVGNSVAELKAILTAGKKSGELRSIAPEFLHVAMIGMCQLFFNRRPLLEELFQRHVTPQALADDYFEFVSQLVLSGISAKSAR
jgi:AcrR family transcriptional regulator